MTCGRCRRIITEPEKAVYSTAWRKHYCGPHDWPTCDRILAERLAEEQAA